MTDIIQSALSPTQGHKNQKLKKNRNKTKTKTVRVTVISRLKVHARYKTEKVFKQKQAKAK